MKEPFTYNEKMELMYLNTLGYSVDKIIDELHKLGYPLRSKESINQVFFMIHQSITDEELRNYIRDKNLHRCLDGPDIELQ
jgi:hypothetical protein